MGYDAIDTKAGEPAWLTRLRDAARARYDGLPGPRVEAWKYTPTHRLSGFEPDGARPFAGVLPAGVPDIDAARLVLVNGVLDASLSDAPPPGATARPLARALGDADLGGRLGAVLDLDKAPLAALNTARFGDGLVIDIAPGKALERPIHVISIVTGGASVDPRFLIDVGENAEATILETHLSQDAGPSVVNAAMELTLAPYARLKHYKLMAEGADAAHVAMTGAVVARDAVYDGFVLQLGAGLARNEMRCRIAGAHAEARLMGGYVAAGEAHVDNTTFIDHAEPDSTSREVYKGVLDGKGRAVFQGKILVRAQAQRTDGHQLNKALLLSPRAEIDSKPELEIYADDVKCSHGATAGALDEEQLFYLRARGIDALSARKLLVEAFLNETLDDIANEAVRAAFAEAVRARLAEGDVA